MPGHARDSAGTTGRTEELLELHRVEHLRHHRGDPHLGEKVRVNSRGAEWCAFCGCGWVIEVSEVSFLEYLGAPKSI